MGGALQTEVPWWRCRRYWLSALLFLGFTIFTSLRANLSIVIVCMVKHRRKNYTFVQQDNSTWSNVTSFNINVQDDQCRQQSVHQEASEAGYEDGEFEWSKELQGILLGAYFWGYGAGFQIFGGWLSQRYGARKVMAFGMLPLGIGSLLTPVAVRVSPYLLLVLRILAGITTGVMFPSAPVFWSRWSPPGEWSRLLTSSLSGGEFGHAVAFPVNGVLCKYGGWELPFYVLGSVCVLWCVVWMLLARDSPSEMPGITEAEKRYIEESIKDRVTVKRTYKTPWCTMLRSKAVWATVTSHCFANFFFYMLLTQAPTFMNEILNFDITSNSLYSALPYIVLVVLVFPTGTISDLLSSKYRFSVTAVRKIMNTLGMVIPAVFLLGLAYLPCGNQAAGVALITASMGAFAFCFCGHIVNMADIALMHSGTLFGFSNTIAAFPGIIAPYVVAHVTKQGTREEWRTAFFIAIVLNVVGALVFLLFSSGEPQPWAFPESVNKTKVIGDPENSEELLELCDKRKTSKINGQLKSKSDSCSEVKEESPIIVSEECRPHTKTQHLETREKVLLLYSDTRESEPSI